MKKKFIHCLVSLPILYLFCTNTRQIKINNIVAKYNLIQWKDENLYLYKCKNQWNYILFHLISCLPKNETSVIVHCLKTLIAEIFIVEFLFFFFFSPIGDYSDGIKLARLQFVFKDVNLLQFVVNLLQYVVT